MSDHKAFLFTTAAALAGALSMAAANAPSQAAAAADGVKCYGVALAGHNGCASATGAHSCAGQATADLSGQEWKLLTPDVLKEAKVDGAPEEVCQEYGQLEPFEGDGQPIPGLTGSDPEATS